jgi:hypothetical protein
MQELVTKYDTMECALRCGSTKAHCLCSAATRINTQTVRSTVPSVTSLQNWH